MKFKISNSFFVDLSGIDMYEISSGEDSDNVSGEHSSIPIHGIASSHKLPSSDPEPEPEHDPDTDTATEKSH